MNIPTREECLQLFEKYKVPKKVVEHCKQVNKIAVFLAKKLKEKGINISVELVDAASLLHDVGRTGIKEKVFTPIHPKEGYNRLKDKYPELAECILTHGAEHDTTKLSWEQKVIQYADKRAKENTMVTVKERFKDADTRYDVPFPKEWIQNILKTEKQIFDIIGIEPDKLGEYID
ncbi:HD domain-containing protein [Candidatus Woesearchaeota archaeon]|nr:HD domain-containing protein [Candidatus Woesearchaeota archaeon]